MNTVPSFSSNSGLPLRGPSVMTDARALADIRKSSARVLLVDDDDDVRRIFAAALKRPNWQIDEASDGEAAWNALCSEDYDILVTDHRMPRLTGLDLIMKLRGTRSAMPCVLISGDLPAEPAELDGMIEPGRTVEKPIMMADFVAVVESVLAASRSGEAARAGQPREGSVDPAPLPMPGIWSFVPSNP